MDKLAQVPNVVASQVVGFWNSKLLDQVKQ
jgi:hypothetical protein